ncbi:CLUMA_CG003607, isoform A [Clunio marinus]|uniref:CLUMA_CG003607, isoform A n=1 Tax=Clunio marinus TaxID=568069 RepID=A0A1J1HQ57_9DIPT|nr:CLUMA_CG003607, isoform A [Clunio marinus]
MSFQVISGKYFTDCGFARELKRLEVPVDEIYKHMCVKKRDTEFRLLDVHSLYRISSKWWCGEKGPGGNCNCGSFILNEKSSGLGAFATSEYRCSHWKGTVKVCLSNVNESSEEKDSSEEVDSSTKAMELSTGEVNITNFTTIEESATQIVQELLDITTDTISSVISTTEASNVESTEESLTT